MVSRMIHSLRAALAAGLLMVASGCGGTTYAMAPDATVPFAKGEIGVSIEDDGNGTFTVTVEHLGDPAKLNPSATTYVVWVQPKKDDSPIQNVGAIKVDDSYSGSHTFKSSYKSFDVTITPEDSADVTKPVGRDVLKASIALDE